MKGTTSEGIVETVGLFTGANLTSTLSRLEREIQGLTSESCSGFLEQAYAGQKVLVAATALKRQAAQINVTIHALGILMCLPHLLEPGEEVQYVSLGAGNTGRDFDLETNLRVAEFKFINWKGGAESIRQNGVFKDYLLLALNPTQKRKYLYLLETQHALKFLRGGRALSSVLSRNDKLQRHFNELFGDRYLTVGDYYREHEQAVRLQDVSPWLSSHTEDLISDFDNSSD